jgi:hypothetical protein
MYCCVKSIKTAVLEIKELRQTQTLRNIPINDKNLGKLSFELSEC